MIRNVTNLLKGCSFILLLYCPLALQYVPKYHIISYRNVKGHYPKGVEASAASTLLWGLGTVVLPPYSSSHYPTVFFRSEILTSL